MSAAETSTKSASAFRTISEVSVDLDVPQHVLRFWETKFPQVKPLKRAGRRRYYRPEDLAILRKIRDLLYKDGYTIKGVQKLFKEGAFKANGARGNVKATEKAVNKSTAISAPQTSSNNTGSTSENSVLQQASGLSLDDQKRLISELKSIRALLD